MTVEEIMEWCEKHKELGRCPYLDTNEKTRYVIDWVELRNYLKGGMNADIQGRNAPIL